MFGLLGGERHNDLLFPVWLTGYILTNRRARDVRLTTILKS